MDTVEAPRSTSPILLSVGIIPSCMMMMRSTLPTVTPICIPTSKPTFLKSRLIRTYGQSARDRPFAKP